MGTIQNSPSVDDLPSGLSRPAQRALAGAGIRNLEQLSRYSAAEISCLHGIGPNAMMQLHRALVEKGLSFTASRIIG